MDEIVRGKRIQHRIAPGTPVHRASTTSYFVGVVSNKVTLSSARKLIRPSAVYCRPSTVRHLHDELQQQLLWQLIEAQLPRASVLHVPCRWHKPYFPGLHLDDLSRRSFWSSHSQRTFVDIIVMETIGSSSTRHSPSGRDESIREHHPTPDRSKSRDFRRRSTVIVAATSGNRLYKRWAYTDRSDSWSTTLETVSCGHLRWNWWRRCWSWWRHWRWRRPQAPRWRHRDEWTASAAGYYHRRQEGRNEGLARVSQSTPGCTSAESRDSLLRSSL